MLEACFDTEKMDIQKCRLCLEEYEEQQMQEIFEEVHTAPTDGDIEDAAAKLKYSQRIEYCCGVRIRESPEMPSKICSNCLEMTNIWFNFRNLCINSQLYLESLCQEDATTSQLVKDTGGKYLDYMVEDLQTFRAQARKTNKGLVVRLAVSDEMQECEVPYYDADTIQIDGSYDSQDEIDALTTTREEPPRGEDKLSILESLKRKLELKCAKKSYDVKDYLRPPTPTSFMCNFCGNVYNKKSTFEHHLSVHSGEKPHECELCGRAFRLKSALRIHMRRHTGEKPYKCNHCNRYFSDCSDRHRHELVHTNTRPYACSFCDKTFTYSGLLKRHIRLHSELRDHD